MAQNPTLSSGKIVHFRAEKNLDKQIDLCRFGAQKDNVTVIIERVTERRDGTFRRTPLLEITPHGDVLEVPAARMRITLMEHAASAHLLYLEGGMNKQAAESHARLNELNRTTQDYIEAARNDAREAAARKRQRQQPGTPTRTRTVNHRKATAGRIAQPFVRAER
jgi:hypothetical protein